MTAPMRSPATACVRGDEATLFAALHRELRRAVARQLVGPEWIADDACAQAWLILLRRQPDRSTVAEWLWVVARHEAWRLAARQFRDVPAVGQVIDGAADPAPVLEVRERLIDAARVLSPRQRRLVGLSAAGFVDREQARITGDSLRTVRRQLARARGALRAAA